VYLATYEGIQVAVKEPLEAYLLTQASLDEWKRELELAYSMRHRNIVCLYGGGLGFNDDADGMQLNLLDTRFVYDKIICRCDPVGISALHGYGVHR
jgi:hypothetical protein